MWIQCKHIGNSIKILSAEIFLEKKNKVKWIMKGDLTIHQSILVCITYADRYKLYIERIGSRVFTSRRMKWREKKKNERGSE